MDKIALRKYVNVLLEYSELINDKNPLIVRRTNAFNGLVTVFVCSPTEPHDVLMPIQSIWVNSDHTSPDYKKAFARTSIDPADGRQNTWVELDDTPADTWTIEEYAANDTLSTNLEIADHDTLGTVKLSTGPVDDNDPVVLTEGDPSLDNARDPLPHDELHDEIPASLISTQSGSVNINRSLFGQYKYLTVVTEHDAYWSFAQLPVPGVSVLPTPSVYDRDAVGDAATFDPADVSHVEVYLV